jgi:periplasmic protein TonB
MINERPVESDVVSVEEVARAAQVPVGDVRTLIEAAGVPHAGRRYLDFDAAVDLVKALRAPMEGRVGERHLFASRAGRARGGRGPFAASGALHAGLLAVMLLVASFSARSEPRSPDRAEAPRLVFLAVPGPGGGGGGGGLRMPTPPPKAELKGRSALQSPVSITPRVERSPKDQPRRIETPTPPAPVATPAPEPPPPPPPAPVPPVVAPVVSAPADDRERPGTVAETSAIAPSQGSGIGGGVGSGRGTGNGEGQGTGIGDGSIAGTGGGPYRPGSGIAPPSILREVQPTYTEEGRRRGIVGDVVLEVVVRADGSVGAVKVLNRLGAGLEQRAVDAVKQWKFSPALRLGTPVDVLVEVAVEFRLR